MVEKLKGKEAKKEVVNPTLALTPLCHCLDTEWCCFQQGTWHKISLEVLVGAACHLHMQRLGELALPG